MKQTYSVITGTGSYIPPKVIPNSAFLNHDFLNANGEPFDRSNEEIIQKFEAITGIQERRYAADDLLASDIAAKAGKKAIEDASYEKEELDYIIVAHNFGDIRADNTKVDIVPSVASRVKMKLGIENPTCIAYDLPFGCPGWVQGLIQANYYLRSGDAKSALIIGTETLSRVCDPHDRDSMIFADGAGATLLEAEASDKPKGILSHDARTDAINEAHYLTMGRSFNSDADDTLYIKMNGRRIYQYALTEVPRVAKNSIDEAGLDIQDISQVLMHQANEKMDTAILERLLALYGIDEVPDGLMPLTISWLGNTSVATIPTMLDLIRLRKLDGHAIESGNHLVFASVGAGMNVNSMVYKVP